MKSSFLPIILVCICGSILCKIPVYSGTLPFTIQNSKKHIEQPLQLTTHIISEKYCAGDADVDVLQMKVLLKYTNLGQQRLILYKGSNLISRQFISQTIEDIMARRFEVDSTVTSVTDNSIKIRGSIPGKLFEILVSGDSYETEGYISVIINRNDQSEITGSIKSGDHILQIEVPTWPESDILAQKLRKRWNKDGLLWYKPIRSEPMYFKVKNLNERNEYLLNCN